MALSIGLVALGGPARAQNVISAKSGLVHYTEGKVLLDGKTVAVKTGSYGEMRENQVLATEEGRAEVLLTPGVFLRVGPNSSLRMITTRLIDTRLELLTGAAVVEADEIGKNTGVTVVCKSGTAVLRKKGLYRFDAEPARLKVFDGEAAVTENGRTVTVTGGKMLSLDGNARLARLDKEDLDALDRWSRRRGEYIAVANVSTAKTLRDSGYSLYSSAWGWNPYFGLWTFLPYQGYLYSPYGYRFWSPVAVGRVYYTPPPPSYGGGNSGWAGASSSGYSSMPSSYSGYSGAAASSSYSAPSHSGSTTSVSSGSSSVGHGGSGGGGGGGHR